MSSDALEWVDVADLLRATGARNTTLSGEEWTFSCHGGAHAHGDASPSAGMNARTSRWRCRSAACGLKGNAVDYMISLKGFTRSEATRVLAERYGGPENSVEQGQLLAELDRIRAMADVHEETRIVLTENEYLDRFALHWPLGAGPDDLPEPMAYMLRRGFESVTMNQWGIGYDELSDRITIPIYDADGILVGIKGRAWSERQGMKYISIGDVIHRAPRYGFNTYHKSQHVFGLDVALSSCVDKTVLSSNGDRVGVARGNGAKSAVLVEGELNVIALRQMGIVGVAAAGSEFSERQCSLIASSFDEVTIYFDGDEAGDKGAERVMQMLSPYMPLKVVFGAFYDAADALDPSKDFSPEGVRGYLEGAQSWLSSRLSCTRS